MIPSIVTEEVNRTVADVKRKVSNPTYAAEYSLIVLIFSALIFGLPVVGYFKDPIPAKKAELQTLKTEVAALQQQKFNRMDLEAEVAKVKDYNGLLTDAVPDDPAVEKYLLEFMMTASEKGIALVSADTLPSEDPFATELHMELQGDITNLNDLLNSLMKLKRYSIVTSIITTRTTITRTEMTVRIFHTFPETIDFTQTDNAKIDTEFLIKKFLPVHERN